MKRKIVRSAVAMIEEPRLLSGREKKKKEKIKIGAMKLFIIEKSTADTSRIMRPTNVGICTFF